MATYLKRSSKLFERLAAVGGGGSGSASTEPSLRELICPVCRSILREPVTLPCAHNLCLRCLRGTVEHNSLSCPLCRQRVGSWLRAATKTESLVNAELWQLIRRRFPQELERAAAGGSRADGPELDLDSGFTPKKKISAAGEIRREYEVQLQIAEEEMRRQREKERLASEALIQKIQEEEEQQKLVQLAQDQLLAKTLAKEEVIEKTNDKHEHSIKATSAVNSNKSKSNANQSKSTTNQKMSVKSKDATDVKKPNMALMSKIRSERHTSNVKSHMTNIQKESSETFCSQKPVPIHNAVTRVVTHQSRVNQPNNSTYSAALGELIGSTSKIYGLQSKEELHVPSDVLSSKKKKLGVEVCVTKVEGEERIGSAESAGSHDSINQEIHHFKPIKALPRTPLRITLDGRQVDPKLIRVLPILKRVSNAVPKPPTPTHLKKMFGGSWSAFKRISKQQVPQKDSLNVQQQEIKKTDRKLEQSRTVSKSSKSFQELDERNAEVAFDSNKNYTKNINKIINGTKVSKKLNLDDQTETGNSAKQSKRAGKMKNGLLPGKHKSQKEASGEKTIEVVEIEDDEPQPPENGNLAHSHTPDPLAFTPKSVARPTSPMLELAMENIAERIKRRKTTRTASNTENVQSAINLVTPAVSSAKSKSKKSSTKGRKSRARKTSATAKPKTKTKTKTVTTTTVTSQIKRLAARSIKRPRYTEDSESEDEEAVQRQLEANEEAELDRSTVTVTPSPAPELEPEPAPIPAPEPEPAPASSPAPSPPKKPRRGRRPKRAAPTTATAAPAAVAPAAAAVAAAAETAEAPAVAEVAAAVATEISAPRISDEVIVREQDRLERLAAQEREDRELALRLQASFNAMERIAGRTRRSTAGQLPTALVGELGQQESVQRRPPQKRAPIK